MWGSDSDRSVAGGVGTAAAANDGRDRGYPNEEAGHSGDTGVDC
jgi:hypothetical protein